MKLFELYTALLENRRDYIKNLWWEKIVFRAFGRDGGSSDYSGDFRERFGKLKNEQKKKTTPPDKVQEAYVEYNQKIADIALDVLAQAGEKHLQWITKQWLNRQFKFEDVPQIKQEIANFERLKRQLPQQYRDLNRIPDLNSLYDLLDRFGSTDTQSNRQKEKALTDQYLKHSEQATLFYQDDNVKVIVPNTQEASCHFGKGTKWCTAATKSQNLFNEYTQDRDLYIIYVNKRKYQLGFEPDYEYDDGWSEYDDNADNHHKDEDPIQYMKYVLMDERDNEIHLEDFTEQYPEAIPALTKIAYTELRRENVWRDAQLQGHTEEVFSDLIRASRN